MEYSVSTPRIIKFLFRYNLVSVTGLRRECNLRISSALRSARNAVDLRFSDFVGFFFTDCLTIHKNLLY